jgi:uncharacterized protein YbbK (DUF523 family)
LSKGGLPRHPVRIGVSSCLLGHEVRYDGGHKRSERLFALSGRAGVELVAICPEVELGLPTPREPIRLQRTGGGPVHLVAPASGIDHSQAMTRFAALRVGELQQRGLCGYVFKSKSPSCGLAVPVYDAQGVISATAPGAFARVLLDLWPELPAIEEGDLEDSTLCERFLEAVFAYAQGLGT